MARRQGRTAIGAAALLGTALLFYLPALRGGYVWDDDLLVTDNPAIRSFAGLVGTWTDLRANTDYYPLTHTSWSLEYRLFRLNAFVMHLNNVLLHAWNAFLFWIILRRLAIPGAWTAAAVFLVHPLHVESVAWVSERKNVLSGLFCLLAVRSYLGSVLPGEDDTARRRSYGISLIWYACALLAKPMTMAAAAVLPLLAWWKHGRLSKKQVLSIVPYLMLAAPMAVVTTWVQYYHVGASGEQFNLSLLQRVILAGRALWFYAGKLAWPRELTFAYAKWTLDPSQWRDYLYPAGAVATLATLGLLRRRLGRGPFVAACAFAVMLSPALGFINVFWHRYYFVADHMPYLASLCLIAPGVALARTGSERLGRRGLAAARGAATAFVCLLGVLTWRQSGLYKDAATIWTDTLRKNPTSWMAHNNLGNILAMHGQAEEAVRHFREALRLFPDYDKAHYNLAMLLLGQGRTDEAILQFREALRLNPGYAEAHYNLGIALDALGRTEEAEREYGEALGFSPK